MKVLLLPDEVYDYLQHVVRAHTLAGIEPEEGFAASQLWSHIGRAQEVTTTAAAPAPTGDDQNEPDPIPDGASGEVLRERIENNQPQSEGGQV